ncbi:alpha/beta-hydrolase [Pluteus cervinus]|uniref:Alpha/beta-hydrolase n=1 Tax=Pluteus cervinus TaxID=181527 RepID=A0ACD3A667_9AGAR|nr:alpha/beta-hydrolase [Pluteus cervinus]
MNMRKLIVPSSGIELAYIDSGAPSQEGYLTIFLLHGLFFNGAVFEKVVKLAPDNSIRIVAINRRGYPGSTPISQADLLAYSPDATDEARSKFFDERGVEFLEFIDTFIVNEKLPPISHGDDSEGKPSSTTGGVALLGWSLGCASALTTLANIEKVPKPVQERVGRNLRGCIFLDPPSILFNVPIPPGLWIPISDVQFDVDTGASFFAYLITSYYTHASINSYSPSTLTHIIPSTHRVPSIFEMTPSQQADIITIDEQTKPEVQFLPLWVKQDLEYYEKVCFDREWRKKYFPSLDLTFVVGEMGPSAAIMSLWRVQADNNKRGGGFVNHKVLKGMNHFPHWDEPQATLDMLKEVVEGK